MASPECASVTGIRPEPALYWFAEAAWVQGKARSASKEPLTTGAPILVSVLVCAFLSGCSSSIQAGLANAPALGHATPETHVQDVIANGRDSCERSGFPRGEVSRGHVPPCGPSDGVLPAPDVPT